MGLGLGLGLGDNIIQPKLVLGGSFILLQFCLQLQDLFSGRKVLGLDAGFGSASGFNFGLRFGLESGLYYVLKEAFKLGLGI